MWRWAFVGLVAACALPPPGAQSIASIEPSSGVNIEDTPVRLQGAGFHLALSTDLDDGTTEVVGCTAMVGTTPLAGIAWRSDELIEGVVTAGMPLGTYDVTVTCDANSTTLPDAFTVLPDALLTGPFGAPTIVAALSSSASDDDPSITADRLELYFNSDRAGTLGGGDIWVTKRATPADAWSPPSNVAELNTASAETTPKVSADGLTLYLASDRAAAGTGNDIYVSTRADRDSPWSTPSLVPELSSPLSDTGANMSPTGRSLVLTSNRDIMPSDLYLSTRATVSDPWGTPVSLVELNDVAGDDADPILTAGDRVVMFVSDRGGGQGSDDIYIATRASASVPFDSPVLVPELNSPETEEDPFISNDLHYILFTSNRSGNFEIYEASR